MTVAYVNRKGQRYYLHQRAGKQGRLRYHFSQKTEGELAEAVPDGYEIYEHPNGQVFLRRQREAVIRPDELALVEATLAAKYPVAYFRLDVRDRAIVVYTSEQDANYLELLIQRYGADTKRVARHLSYAPALRFQLTDDAARTFRVERYDYRGREPEWKWLAAPEPLATQVARFPSSRERDY